jgi:hypothetical protein
MTGGSGRRRAAAEAARTLLRLAWLLGRELPERVPYVFKELHLRQIRAQCFTRRRHQVDSGMARFLRRLPERFALLPDRLELLAILLTVFPGSVGEYTKPFRLSPCGFRHLAVFFGIRTTTLGVFPPIFRPFPALLGRRSIHLRRRSVSGHMRLLDNQPTPSYGYRCDRAIQECTVGSAVRVAEPLGWDRKYRPHIITPAPIGAMVSRDVMNGMIMTAAGWERHRG